MTRGGEVKVADFGLAKASTQLEKTDPGVVKGKFSYLSPEAALGQEVDARTDVFAVGIVLWEMLAGRRLFLGETDYETVKLVQRAEVPSLKGERDEVDDELDALLLKTLARERDERYQTAHELGDAIADYLFSHRLKVTSYDIARMMQSVVATRADEKRRKMDSSIIDQLISDELLTFTSLDEMSDPVNPSGQRSVAGGRTSAEATERQMGPGLGARPLDAGSFGRQESNAWYIDDDSVDEATNFFDRSTLDAHRERQQESAQERSARARGAARKRRPDRQGTRRPEAGRRPQRSARFRGSTRARRAPSRSTSASARRDPGRGRRPAAQGQRSSGALKYVLITVVMAGAGAAAAWFSGLIPH